MGIVLIIGGSRDTGRATTLQLAQKGCTVTINSHHNIRATTEVASTVITAEEKTFTLRADINNGSQAMATFESIDHESEPLTALANNTGILSEQSTVGNLAVERINRVLVTNVISYFLCCREAVRHMLFKHGGQGGAIMSVSSAALRLGASFEHVDYAASKGVVDMLTTGLALETAAWGVRVNCVRPGLICTETYASGGEPGRVDRVKSILPMQHGGQPEEVVQAITWLLSEKTPYVAGNFLGLVGGK